MAYKDQLLPSSQVCKSKLLLKVKSFCGLRELDICTRLSELTTKASLVRKCSRNHCKYKYNTPAIRLTSSITRPHFVLQVHSVSLQVQAHLQSAHSIHYLQHIYCSIGPRFQGFTKTCCWFSSFYKSNVAGTKSPLQREVYKQQRCPPQN